MSWGRAPQRLHLRPSIVILPASFVVLKWFVVNMTEHRCLIRHMNSRNSFQADFAAPRKRFRRNPGKVQPGQAALPSRAVAPTGRHLTARQSRTRIGESRSLIVAV
jgi:hypothetical protein